jgi:hypothetical protein
MTAADLFVDEAVHLRSEIDVPGRHKASLSLRLARLAIIGNWAGGKK